MGFIDEKCENCKSKKVRYYKTYCPVCEAPQPQTREYYNLFECMYHIEACGHLGFKDSLWKIICNKYNFSNDSIIYIMIDEDSHPLEKELFKKLNIGNDIQMAFLVSW